MINLNVHWNLAHKNNRSEIFKLSTSEYISILKARISIDWKDHWDEVTNIVGKGTFLRRFSNHIEYNHSIFNIPKRRLQVLITRFRIGHIGTRAYLHRFRMAEHPFCENPSCLINEVQETIDHMLLQCPAYSTQRNVLVQKLSQIGIGFTLENLLLGNLRIKKYFPLIISYFNDFISTIPRTSSYF